MKVKFIILGSGYSLGVPSADGYWGKCNPKTKKNYRTRCSAFIKSKIKNIIIDTSPDLRNQLIKNKITNIDCAIFSHKHGDQIHGINDLRVFYLKSKKRLPVYADKNTARYLLKTFKYCFLNTNEYPPILKLNKLKRIHNFQINREKLRIQSVPVKHGNINSICYIINNKCAYASDVSKIYNKDIKKFFNLKYLVIDCLRYSFHYSHYNLDNVLKLIRIIKPKKTILTNLNNEMDYSELKRKLPKNVSPAYDGLSFYI